MKSIRSYVLLGAAVGAAWGQRAPLVELDAGVWRSSARGTVQSGLIPVDLRRDLALEDRALFFGTATFRVGQKHQIVLEGSPIEFEGRNTLERTIRYNNQTYTIAEEIQSATNLTYFFAGHQWDFLTGAAGSLGLRTGAAYLGASGRIRSATTGLSAERSYRIGLPLAGPHGQVFPIRKRLEVFGGVQGIPLGGYGHYVQASGGAGLHFGPLGFRAGYRMLDADVHERGPATEDRAGVAPRISGPVFSLVLRAP